MRISDWSSDVCSSDLRELAAIAGDHAIQSGRFERMLAAHAIRNPALRDQALAEVALQAVEKGSLTEADRLSERIGSAGLRAEVLTRITARLAEEKYTQIGRAHV